MKRHVLFLFLVAFASSVVSCSKDEAAPVTIEGKWVFDTSTHTKGGKIIEERESNDPACDKKGYLDLKAGGAMEQGVVNPSNAETDPCVLKKSNATWKSENNILTLNFGTGAMPYQIVSLTADKLQYKFVNPMDPGDYYIFTMKR